MTQGANYQATASLNIGPFSQAAQQMLNQWNQVTAGMKRGTQKTAVNQGFAAAMKADLVETVKLQKQQQLQQQRHLNIIAQQQQRHQNIMAQIAARSAAIAKRATGGRGGNQHFPTHAPAVQKQLINLSSAAQGTMIAFSALQGSIQGVLFGLVFLGWSNLKVSLSFAALALSIGTVVKSARLLLGLAKTVGREWETTGQRLALSLGSAAKAMEVLAKASSLSGQFGLPQADTRDAIGQLAQLGLATDTYIKGLANTAQGTGQTMTEVTKQFIEITTADADKRRSLIEAFAKENKIAIKDYGNSLELAMALQDRWNGSLELMAQTQEGMVGRIRSAWTDFGVSVGIVLNSYIKPVLSAILALAQGLSKGFAEAMKTSEATGEMQRNAANFNALITVLIPKLYMFGFIIGKVVFKAIQITAQVIKVLADALIRLWNKLKPIIDTLRNLIPKIKELIGWIIAWYTRHKDLIDTIGQVLLALLAFNLAMKALNLLVQTTIGLITGLAQALFGLPFKVISIGIEGVAEALSAIGAIANALASLGGKAIDITALGLWDLLGGLESLAGKMKDVADRVASDAARMAKAFGDAMDEMERKARKGISVSVNWLNNLASSLLSMAPQLGLILAQLFTNPVVLAAMSNPVVAAVIAGAILAGLAAAFPFQTGQVVAAFGEVIVAMALAIPIFLISVQIRTVTFFINFFNEVVKAVARSIWAIVEPVFKTLMDDFTKAFGLIKDLIIAIITGDWKEALIIALELIWLIFFQLPVDIAKAIGEGLRKIATDIIPDAARAIKDAFVESFGFIWDTFKGMFEAIWPWVSDWFTEFKNGFMDRAGNIFDPLLWALQDLVDAIDGFFSMFGIHGIGKKIMDFFGSIKDAISRMPNPFTHFGDYVNWFIDRINDMIDAYNRVPLLPNVGNVGRVGGGGSSSGTTSGGTAPAPPSVSQRIGAYIINAQPLGGGVNKYLIQPSYWSNDNAPSPVEVTSSMLPDLSKYVFGGRVPGVRGEKQLVLAEGGEMFGGHPTFAEGRSGSRGSGINVTVEVRDSVVTNDIVREIGNQVAKILVSNLSGNRRMMFNRG